LNVIERRILPVVSGLLAEEPVIALQGPRAVGKTTLLRHLADAHGVQIVDLDDLATRDAVASDPALFVSGPGPVCIDEYQHVPQLLDAIKAELNRDARPGRFIITGSTRHDALPAAAQSLTGRLHRMTVYPFSQGEITGTREHFLDMLLEDASTLISAAPSTTTRDDYIARIAAGGFPMAMSRSETARNRWFDDYVNLSLQRDVQELSRIRQKEALPRLLARLAAQTAQVLNIRAVAEQVGLTPDTGENYTRLLEDVYLIHRLPAWGKTLRARAVATPKLHLVDAGLAARLLRLSASKLTRPDATSQQQFGHLLETFVVLELLKQASWLEGIAGTGHWRTHDGIEVDLVLEFDDGRIVAIEVKAGSRIAGRDLNGLRGLREALGDRFVAGVALHTGQRSYSPEDRIYVLPVDSLWAPA
jgi:uncharacterized protein